MKQIAIALVDWFCLLASFACTVFGGWLTAKYMIDPYTSGSMVFSSFLASLGASFAFVHFITKEK